MIGRLFLNVLIIDYYLNEIMLNGGDNYINDN